MDKKSLKWYETPAMELINVNVEGQLLAGSAGNGGAENMGGEGMGDEEE